jgi:hypothetical protein
VSKPIEASGRSVGQRAGAAAPARYDTAATVRTSSPDGSAVDDGSVARRRVKQENTGSGGAFPKIWRWSMVGADPRDRPWSADTAGPRCFPAGSRERFGLPLASR